MVGSRHEGDFASFKRYAYCYIISPKFHVLRARDPPVRVGLEPSVELESISVLECNLGGSGLIESRISLALTCDILKQKLSMENLRLPATRW